MQTQLPENLNEKLNLTDEEFVTYSVLYQQYGAVFLTAPQLAEVMGVKTQHYFRNVTLPKLNINQTGEGRNLRFPLVSVVKHLHKGV